jgi:hypothetical protein
MAPHFQRHALGVLLSFAFRDASLSACFVSLRGGFSAPAKRSALGAFLLFAFAAAGISAANSRRRSVDQVFAAAN